MKQENMGDIPYIKGLDKQEPLETNPAKKTWFVPKTRHIIKQCLKQAKKVYNNI